MHQSTYYYECTVRIAVELIGCSHTKYLYKIYICTMSYIRNLHIYTYVYKFCMYVCMIHIYIKVYI